jgi:membrane protein DedA with SNARE-associated domain/rhodanese-related sulfurtransferase
MNLLDVIAHHGYAVTSIAMFVTCCGIPLPVSVVLLTAGAAAHGGPHGGPLNLGLVLLCAAGSALAGDTLLYLGGRYTGWWLLGVICKFSINPETCIFGSAKSFYERGPKTLLFAKFVPGLATVAAPLAGSLNMKLRRFLLLDGCGVSIYTGCWVLTGFICAPFLRVVVRGVQRVGHVTAAMFITALALYLVWLVVSSFRDTHFSDIEKVSVVELLERMRVDGGDKLLIIADVRSHGYYDPGMQRIKNSIRVEPSRLKEELEALRAFMQPECEIYLYCSCAREATSIRVAKMLELEHCSTKVIQGGMRAWVKAGGPLEPVPAGDVEHLPRFD